MKSYWIARGDPKSNTGVLIRRREETQTHTHRGKDRMTTEADTGVMHLEGCPATTRNWKGWKVFSPSTSREGASLLMPLYLNFRSPEPGENKSVLFDASWITVTCHNRLGTLSWAFQNTHFPLLCPFVLFRFLRKGCVCLRVVTG